MGYKHKVNRFGVRYKLTAEDVKQIRKLLKKGTHTQRDIAEMYNVHPVTISQIKTGKIWPKTKKQLEAIRKADRERYKIIRMKQLGLL